MTIAAGIGGSMKPLLQALSSIPVSIGLPEVRNADARYYGRHEMRLAKAVGITEFGVNHVTLKPGTHSIIMVVGSRRPGEEVIHYPDDDFGPIRKEPAANRPTF